MKKEKFEAKELLKIKENGYMKFDEERIKNDLETIVLNERKVACVRIKYADAEYSSLSRHDQIISSNEVSRAIYLMMKVSTENYNNAACLDEKLIHKGWLYNRYTGNNSFVEKERFETPISVDENGNITFSLLENMFKQYFGERANRLFEITYEE